MLTEMKTSAVVLCVATISSLEPLQVIAPKEQPSQWRGDQHRWWNGQPQWGNEQGQNPWHTQLEPLQVVATKDQKRRNQLNPYMLPVTERAQTSANYQQQPFALAGGAAASQQPLVYNQFYTPQSLEQGYSYPSGGGYAQQGPPGMAPANPQHNKYNFAANMMPDRSTYHKSLSGIPQRWPTASRKLCYRQLQSV